MPRPRAHRAHGHLNIQINYLIGLQTISRRHDYEINGKFLLINKYKSYRPKRLRQCGNNATILNIVLLMWIKSHLDAIYIVLCGESF